MRLGLRLKWFVETAQGTVTTPYARACLVSENAQNAFELTIADGFRRPLTRPYAHACLCFGRPGKLETSA